MGQPKFIKQLNENRIHDGLLRDFISRGLYLVAQVEIANCIQLRYKEIEYLEELREQLGIEIEAAEGTPDPAQVSS